MENLLPIDGKVHLIPDFWSEKESNHLFNRLWEDVDWKHDEIMMFGKRIITKRKVAWYGNSGSAYTYSKVTKNAKSWIPVLTQIKGKVEGFTHESFQTCLLNLYHDGSEGMSWHSDDESDLKVEGMIASVSFGARRKFVCKHKTQGSKVEIWLDPGSLLIMSGTMQQHWWHSLPKSSKVTTPRINLTFRQMRH